jgi:hypothetical protein
MALDTYSMNQQHAEYLKNSLQPFLQELKKQVTQQLIDDAVDAFRERITPEIMKQVDAITIQLLNTYYEPMRQQPKVEILYKI